MFDRLNISMPMLRDLEPVGGYRTEANIFRSGYSNSGNGSIAGRGHLHLREIARRGTRPGTELRRQAMADVAHYKKTGQFPGESEIRVFS